MDYKDYLKKMNSDKIKNVALIYGEEEYLINYIIEELINKRLTDRDFDLIKLRDLKNTDKILDALQSFPLIDNSKIILVRDSNIFKTGINGEDFEILLTKIKNIDKSTFVIFEENNVDKRSKMYKLIKKNGDIAECNIQSDSELAKWVVKIFKKNKKKISYQTSREFIQFSDKKMNSILSETEKMISFLGEEDVLTKENMQKLVTKNINDTIFQLIDSILEKNEKKAYNLLNEMIYLREAEQKILYLITINFINMYQIKVAYKKNKNINSAYKETDIKFSWLAKKLLNTSKNISIEELKEIIAECVETDRRIKKGLMPPRLSLEYLIGKIV